MARADVRSPTRSDQRMRDEDEMGLRDLPFGAKLIVCAALAALALHLGGLTLDATALVLIALALSPWITLLFERLRFGEFEVTLRTRQRRQQTHIDGVIRTLLMTVVSDWELRHLERFAAFEPFHARLSASFERELRRLIEAGLIRRRPGRGIRTLGRGEPSDDAKDHFEVTEAGRRFLEVHRQLVAEEAAAEEDSG